jgi:two-component system, OmpR family, response regulator
MTTAPLAAGRPTGQPHLTRPDGSPVRVLVVDDEPNLAELLTSALRYEGRLHRSRSRDR